MHIFTTRCRLFAFLRACLYVPTVELSGETAVLGLARKVERHDFLSKLVAFADDKGPAVGQPTDGFLGARICENLHEALRKNLGVVLFVIIFQLDVVRHLARFFWRHVC